MHMPRDRNHPLTLGIRQWRILNERKRFLQQFSASVARRNYAIFNNAWPRRGGETPTAPPIDFE
jgi:hypothetical protein